MNYFETDAVPPVCCPKDNRAPEPPATAVGHSRDCCNLTLHAPTAPTLHAPTLHAPRSTRNRETRHFGTKRGEGQKWNVVPQKLPARKTARPYRFFRGA